MVLGTALSYNIITGFLADEYGAIDFQVPWVRLAILITVAYVASAVMSLIPARSPSKVPVAEALRYAGYGARLGDFAG